VGILNDERATPVVLVGEPGIGKSSLLEALMIEAETREFRVLSARPAESEGTLAYATLSDLFGDVEPGAMNDRLSATNGGHVRELIIPSLTGVTSRAPTGRRTASSSRSKRTTAAGKQAARGKDTKRCSSSTQTEREPVSSRRGPWMQETPAGHPKET
jgi:MoxR-like ATPase